MSYTQAIKVNASSGLTLYANLFDNVGEQIGVNIYDDFIDLGNNTYTFVYDGFPNDFYGSCVFFNSFDDVIVDNVAVNPAVVPLLFSEPSIDSVRQKDILIYRGNITQLTWLIKGHTEPVEIVFTIKFDMLDDAADAMLVVSLTNGCETVLGVPANDASLAIITYDDNFVYCVLKAELTDMFSSVTGIQKYDVVIDDITIAYGNCSVVIGGSV